MERGAAMPLAGAVGRGAAMPAAGGVGLPVRGGRVEPRGGLVAPSPDCPSGGRAAPAGVLPRPAPPRPVPPIPDCPSGGRAAAAGVLPRPVPPRPVPGVVGRNGEPAGAVPAGWAGVPRGGTADLKGDAGAGVAGLGGTACAVPGVAGVPSLGRCSAGVAGVALPVDALPLFWPVPSGLLGNNVGG